MNNTRMGHCNVSAYGGDGTMKSPAFIAAATVIKARCGGEISLRIRLG